VALPLLQMSSCNEAHWQRSSVHRRCNDGGGDPLHQSDEMQIVDQRKPGFVITMLGAAGRLHVNVIVTVS
jgi:hypothetical protein